MQKLSVSIMLAAGLAAPVAVADSADQSHSWENEPTAFLGVPFHGNFMKNVPECPEKPERPTMICRSSTSNPSQYEIRGLPYIPISSGYQLFATIQSDAITQMMLTGNASSLELVDDFLTDTLGQPNSSVSRRIQLTSGASYEIKSSSWEGKKIAVHFQRDEKDLSRYAVIFTPTTTPSPNPKTPG